MVPEVPSTFTHVLLSELCFWARHVPIVSTDTAGQPSPWTHFLPEPQGGWHSSRDPSEPQSRPQPVIQPALVSSLLPPRCHSLTQL